MTDQAATEPVTEPVVEPVTEPASNPAEPTIAAVPGEDLPGAATWPEDWRTQFSDKEDDQKTLKRFKAPGDVWKSYDALRKKVSGGEYTRTRPETDDPEALKAWRTEIGVPDTPEGYLDKLPEGLEVPAEDQPTVDKYLERMHAEGADPKHVHDGLAWYYETQQQAAEERSMADKSHRTVAQDELREEWGPEYRGNINGMTAMLETYAPEGLKEELFTARTDDGTLLGDHQGFLKMMVNMSNELNPHGIITPSVGEDRMANLDTRIKELETEMADTKSRNSPDSYWSSPAKQEEYRRLLTLQERHKAA